MIHTNELSYLQSECNILERQFQKVTELMRNYMSGMDAGAFHLAMKSSGRTGTGDALVVMRVGVSEYGSDAVEANSIIAAMVEAMRRAGFEKTHQPLCLPRGSTAVTEELSQRDDNSSVTAEENAAILRGLGPDDEMLTEDEDFEEQRLDDDGGNISS